MTRLEEIQLVLENEGALHSTMKALVGKYHGDVLYQFLRNQVRGYFPCDFRPYTPDEIDALVDGLCARFEWKSGKPAKPAQPENAGKPWTTLADRDLVRHYQRGISVADMAEIFSRTQGGILGRLAALGEMNYDTTTKRYTPVVRQLLNPIEKKEPPIMANIDATKPLQTISFVYGSDARDVSDGDIFKHIASLENQIKSLDAIEHKPKKLVAQIDSLKADIIALSDFVDGRP